MLTTHGQVCDNVKVREVGVNARRLVRVEADCELSG